MVKSSAKTKRVLLYLRKYRRKIHQVICDYAQNHEWLIEFQSRMPTAWYGDGIIADWVDATEIARIRNRQPIPVVTRSPAQGRTIGRVHGDLDAVARMGMNHFATRGHRHMVGIDISTGDRPDAARRFYEVAQTRGYKASHFCYGKNRDDLDFRGSVRRLAVFLRNLPKPSALFLGGPHCANIVYRACELENIRIPQDLSVLANDDDPLVCEAFLPQLSGIAGEDSHIGLAMARMLDRMMANPTLKPPPLFVSPEKIITRQSTDVLAVTHLPTARALNFIFENCGRQIGVEEVSRSCGISVTSLRNFFRHHVGKAPNQFLREVRMERAKKLLEETDLIVDQIARQTGYSCGMSLNAAFKQLFHMTPGAYRADYHSTRLTGLTAPKP